MRTELDGSGAAFAAVAVKDSSPHEQYLANLKLVLEGATDHSRLFSSVRLAAFCRNGDMSMAGQFRR